MQVTNYQPKVTAAEMHQQSISGLFFMLISFKTKQKKIILTSNKVYFIWRNNYSLFIRVATLIKQRWKWKITGKTKHRALVPTSKRLRLFWNPFFACTVNTTNINLYIMPFSQPTWVNNFCFNLLLPFLSIVHILSSQAISVKLYLFALFLRFCWLILLPFPSYFKIHNLTYLGVDVLKDDMTLHYHIFNLHNNTQHILKNIRRHPINQSYSTHHPDDATLHPTQPLLICNSRFPCFTIVQQNWSNTTLISLSLLLQR